MLSGSGLHLISKQITVSKSKMMSRRQGGGNEAHMNKAAIAYLTGKK
jgi:hypothetical protein